MKLIAFSDSPDLNFFKTLYSVAHTHITQILTFVKPADFIEAVRTNISPKPVIVFSGSNRSSFYHLSEIQEYIVDAVLLLIVPNEEVYQAFQNKVPLYPRYIFFKEDEQALLSAILDKLATPK